MANKYLVPRGYKNGHKFLREEFYGYSHEVVENGDGTYNVTTVANAAENAIFFTKDTGLLLMRSETPTKWYKQ